MSRQLAEAVSRGRFEEAGAAMVEYAIVTAVIAVAALTAAQAVGTGVVGVFNDIVSALTSL